VISEKPLQCVARRPGKTMAVLWWHITSRPVGAPWPGRHHHAGTAGATI